MGGYPQEVKDYIFANYKGIGPKAMTELVNEKFGTQYRKNQMKGFYANHKLNSGLTGRFEKGHVPANKGTHPPTVGRMAETQFKKGGLPPNTKPIGYERITRDGYTEVKIAMRPDRKNGIKNFILKHRLVWEQANGPIPKGYNIIFKDGDKTNCDIDNLALISKTENLTMMRRGLRSEDPQLTETGVLIARAEVTMRKRRKETRRNENGDK